MRFYLLILAVMAIGISATTEIAATSPQPLSAPSDLTVDLK